MNCPPAMNMQRNGVFDERIQLSKNARAPILQIYVCTYNNYNAVRQDKQTKLDQLLLNMQHLPVCDRITVASLQYKLKRCSPKECCKQCRHVKFNSTMTKWPVHGKHTEQHKHTQNTKTQQTFRKKTCLCVFKAQLIKICITLLLFVYIIVAAADTRSFKINKAQEQKQLWFRALGFLSINNIIVHI